jgi:Flp pilus assembly protein TadD
VAYQQRRVADALRDAIDKMKVGGTASPANETVQSLRRAPVDAPAALDEASTPEVAASERGELEHRGASLIGSNNFAGALAHYQRLTRLFPKEAVFGDVVAVLKAKLRCSEPVGGLCP